MPTITYTAPSGKIGTYTTIGDTLSYDGGEATSLSTKRIESLVRLAANSITEDGTNEQHRDNLFQALVSLAEEIEASEKPVGFLTAGEIVTAIKTALNDSLD